MKGRRLLNMLQHHSTGISLPVNNEEHLPCCRGGRAAAGTRLSDFLRRHQTRESTRIRGHSQARLRREKNPLRIFAVVGVECLKHCSHVPQVLDGGGIGTLLLIVPELKQGDCAQQGNNCDYHHQLDEGESASAENAPDALPHEPCLFADPGQAERPHSRLPTLIRRRAAPM